MSKQTRVVSDEVPDVPVWGKLFFNLLENIEKGSVTILTPEGAKCFFEGEMHGPNAVVSIQDWVFCEELFLKGDIGLGESYIREAWSSPDVSNVIRFGIENRDALTKIIKGSIHKIILYRIKHLFNKNTKAGSKRNIQAHYDLGNDFYKLWLDDSMTYSSALYREEKGLSLIHAQERKYQNILDELSAKPGDHILEVGCGWGGFMEYAAQRNIKVTGVTISKEQYNFTQNRLKKNSDLASVELKDYRDVEGKYDHIVSIEMFEALGEAYWKKYFKSLKKLLKASGRIVVQSITINHKDFLSYRKGTDFIQQYIFPGGILPSVEVFRKIAGKCGLTCIEELEFGKDYGKTLHEWDKKFNANLASVREQGFDEDFIRMWNFYLNYCRGGFEAKQISVSQFTLKHTAL